MALDVDTIVERARDLHPAFDKQQSPGPAALGRLTALAQELFSKAVNINESVLPNTKASLDVTAYDFDTGHNVGEIFRWVRAEVVSTTSRKGPFHLVPWEQRHDPEKFPSGYLDGETLWLVGTSKDWTDLASVDYEVLALPGSLSAGGSIALPADAEWPLVAGLGYYFATRAKKTSEAGINVSEFRDIWIEAKNQFETNIAARKTAEVSRIRDVRR